MIHPEELLARAIDVDLSADDRARVDAHLRDCDRCRLLAQDLRRQDVLLRRREPRAPLSVGTVPAPVRSWPGLLRPALFAAAVLVLAVVAGTGMAALRTGNSQSDVASLPTPTSTAVPTASLPAAVPATPVVVSSPEVRPSPPPTAPACVRSSGTMGEVAVCPGTGTVGTVVQLEGRDCNTPGGPAIMYFGSAAYFGTDPQGATYGAVEIGRFAVDDRGRFSALVRIPAQLQPIQNRGGGTTTPGAYAFYSKPDTCVVSFTVRDR